MADKANRQTESTEESPVTEAVTSRPKLARLLGKLVTKRLLLTLLALSATGHVIGYLHYCLTVAAVSGPIAPEVSLGRFRYNADPNYAGPIAAADFSLHVSLLAPVDRAARFRLAQRRYRVQQSIEELLRSARCGDFEDPALLILKRRLQEQINETIGLRGVDEVIVTGLSLERSAVESAPDTAASVACVSEST
jgi:hypothetical protein